MELCIKCGFTVDGELHNDFCRGEDGLTAAQRAFLAARQEKAAAGEPRKRA